MHTPRLLPARKLARVEVLGEPAPPVDTEP